VLDAGAVTALRTGAAAVLAAETLGRSDAQTAAVVGAGVNGKAAARTFLARGRDVALYDVDPQRVEAAVADLNTLQQSVARSVGLEEALGADLLVTMTPGHEILLPEGSLQPGQHVSLMGADGPGKAEIAVAELLRARIFADDWEQSGPSGTLDPDARVRLYADDWEQASHNGELAHAVERGLTRDDVTQLGDVLADTARGRQSNDDITIFDSTGLAIQDLAIALVAMERADELDLPTIDL
jgi:ornithine cyclodeaminase/alanine dehydrogenase-like protein (mu-crystallin family)